MTFYQRTAGLGRRPGLFMTGLLMTDLLMAMGAPMAMAGPAAGSAAETAPVTPAETPADEKDALALIEIIVTSTGFGEPRATHPGNISKIYADEIDFTKAEQPAELLNRVPGVGIEQGSGVEHLTAIRSPVLTGTAGAGSFLYLEDGVPMRAAGFANVNELMDAMTEEAGGIEVIRGPASALYGSNAEHGLVNILSRAPSPVPEASLTGWLGPHGVENLWGTASTTVKTGGDATQGFRGSFALNEDGGFRAASGYGQQKTQVRYDYDAIDTSVKATLDTMNVNQETAGYVTDPSDPANIDAYKIDSLRKSNPNPEAYRDAWAIRAAMRMERDLGSGEKIALTPYARTNGMNFLMHFQPGEPVEKNGHWSGGLLTSFEKALSGGHKLIFGFDTEYTDGYLEEIQSGPSAAGGYITGLHYNFDVKSIVLAPYLHTVWQLAPRTQLTVGFRYEFTRYDYTNLAGPTDTSTPRTTDRFARPDDRVDTFSNPTPKIGLTHIFSDEVTGFLNLAHAARAPQVQDLYRLQKVPGGTAPYEGPDPSTIKSEILDSIEIGARGKVRRFSYEVATYFMKKHNYAFRDSNGDNVTDGKTQHVGIEAEIATPLGWNFDLAASATYARHTYAFTHSSTSFETFGKGDDIDTAPRTLADMRLGYSFDSGLGRAELEWVHVGAYWMDASHTEQYPGHDIFNLRSEYALTDNLSVFGRIENLFDKKYADRADFFQGKARFFPGDDRGLYAGATVKF